MLAEIEGIGYLRWFVDLDDFPSINSSEQVANGNCRITRNAKHDT